MEVHKEVVQTVCGDKRQQQRHIPLEVEENEEVNEIEELDNDPDGGGSISNENGWSDGAIKRED